MNTITVALLIAVSVALIGWDVYVYAKKGKTISEYMSNAGRSHPIVPFLLGVIIGHWFWSVCP